MRSLCLSWISLKRSSCSTLQLQRIPKTQSDASFFCQDCLFHHRGSSDCISIPGSMVFKDTEVNGSVTDFANRCLKNGTRRDTMQW